MPLQWHVLNQNTSTFLLIYVLKVRTSTIQKLTFNSTIFLERGKAQAGKWKPESERVQEEGRGEERKSRRARRMREIEITITTSAITTTTTITTTTITRTENSLFFEETQECVIQLTKCAKGKNFKCLPIPSNFLSMISALGSLLMYWFYLEIILLQTIFRSSLIKIGIKAAICRTE